MYFQGLNVFILKVLNLVFHQRNQRGYHNANTFYRQGINLESNRFSSTGGHKPERIFAGSYRFNNIELQMTELRIVPVTRQYLFIAIHQVQNKKSFFSITYNSAKKRNRQ